MELTVIVQLTQGFILGVMRINEPLYKQLVIKEILSWFGELLNDHESHDTQKKLSSFGLMNEQLSIDLLYVILRVITDHSVGVKKHEHWHEYHAFDFTNVNTFTIEHMVVQNPERFNVQQDIVCKSLKLSKSLEDVNQKKLVNFLEQQVYPQKETPDHHLAFGN